jgi:outer membrane protein with beta-barrel domain
MVMRQFSRSILLPFIVLVGAWASLYAQTPIRLGVNTGVNFANLSLPNNDPYENSKSYHFGLLIGGVAEFGITDDHVWYIQIEPRYIQEGMKVRDAFNITYYPEGPGGASDVTGDADYKLDFLEIPVLFEAKFGTADFKPFVFAGPDIGFLISAKYEGPGYDPQSLVQAKLVSLDIRDRIEGGQFSLDLGGGVEHQVSRRFALVGSARYRLGVTNLYELGFDSYPMKSYGIQIVVGALFDL